MPVGYRSILSTETSIEHRDRIEAIVAEWFAEKGFEDLPKQGSARVDDSTVEVSAVEGRGIAARRWRLSETWEPPRWYAGATTSRLALIDVTIVETMNRTWVWVDIEPPSLTLTDSRGETRVEPQQTGTPRFVSRLIDAVPLMDGQAEPWADLQVIASSSHVEQLTDIIRDGSRIGAVYVSVPPEGVPVDRWSDDLSRIIRGTQGLAVGYVVAGAVADELSAQLGRFHRVPAGAMRTFLPGAEPGSPEDGFRHRILQARSLADSDRRRLNRVIRNAQIAAIARTPLPRVLREADYELLRASRTTPYQELERRFAEATIPTATGEFDRAFVEDLFEQYSRAQQQAEEAAHRQLELGDALDFARAERDELVQQNDDLYDRLIETRDRESRLSRRLFSVYPKDAAAAIAEAGSAPEIEYPATFAELLDRMQSLDGLLFLGDRDETRELDAQSALGVAAVKKAWDALATASAYVACRREGDFDDSLRAYIERTPGGRFNRFPRVAWQESETVRNDPRMRRQRQVRAPESIAVDGVVEMFAHVPLATHRGTAPRLYFDDAFGAHGVVLVGRISGHLDTAGTN
ncbi:hypothetical protein [Rathayibacter sp. AY1F8]|uniref:hypothetical protein n=1 Tax=Rathayibacter sp. AY1F8 TaxID=2080562 RepID=UPI000CE8696E|nr:hypothetical protein [Rathayibacter sp. AY1F8]PPH16141.1 hypothetical protein C5C35_11120 [Rathayibacter sp. AY1F8]